MMRTTYPAGASEEPTKLAFTPTPHLESAPAKAPAREAGGDKWLVGLDLGTNTTCLKAGHADSPDPAVNEIVPTVVGYAKEGIVANLLPGNAKMLFGSLAMKNRLYLRVVPPLRDGVIDDLAAAQDFARHLGKLIGAPNGADVRAVIGVPANAERSAREAIATVFAGVFQKILLIPEPFLAALGYRNESQLENVAYVDPVRNSLFVDIGAGTTDVCLVQGYFPGPDDQVSASFAGDDVDNILHDAIRRDHPEVEVSMMRVRELKEQHSYVGKEKVDVPVEVLVGGKSRRLELGALIRAACHELLENVFDLVKTAIGRASSDSVGDLMQNIILTGGGSRIRNLDTELQRLLVEDGYVKPRILTVGPTYKEFVAKGALVAARQARQSQWQTLPA